MGTGETFTCVNKFRGHQTNLRCEGWCNGHSSPWTTERGQGDNGKMLRIARAAKMTKSWKGDDDTKRCSWLRKRTSAKIYLWGDGDTQTFCDTDAPGKCEWDSMACAACSQCPTMVENKDDYRNYKQHNILGFKIGDEE